MINTLNLSLQGPLTTIFTMYNKVYAFKKIIQLWITRIREGNLEMFESF